MKYDFIYRKKPIDSVDSESSKLSRVLGFLDITALGVSCTLGSGIYVLSGSVITLYSGPAVIVSFILASVATLLSGLCYAELGAKVPKSGSAYVYIYVTIGEFAAFIMGWDLILEYVIGVSAITNAVSQYINSLSGNKIREAFRQSMPINIPYLSAYPDFLSFFLAGMVTILLVIGVRESTFLNKIFTCINIVVLGFIIVCGATKADFKNWNINAEYQNQTLLSNQTILNQYKCDAHSKRCGNGGFAPFGISGIIGGAAKAFYAYIGFDVISSAGEETKNPKRNIPLSILLTLVIVTILYCGLSGVITLMIPYNILNPDIPLPDAFNYVHMKWASYFVSTGAVISLLTCLYGSMFPLPRIIYAMASDGLIFRVFSKIWPRFKTPYIACMLSGLLAALLATFLNLDELVDMLSIGTLIAYSFVNICVLILRYKPSENDNSSRNEESIFKRLFFPKTNCSKSTSQIVNISSFLMLLFITGLCVFVAFVPDLTKSYCLVVLVILVLIILLIAFVIWRQPQNPHIKTFKVPFLPFLPMLSLFFNIYLLTSLTVASWIRFLVWFAIGLILYAVYGIRNSSENSRNKAECESELTCTNSFFYKQFVNEQITSM